MRRNWDTVLSVLTKIEELNDRAAFHQLYPEHIDSGRVATTPEAAETVFHLRLLIQNGFVNGSDFPAFGATGLTWAGHDLIEKLRAAKQL